MTLFFCSEFGVQIETLRAAYQPYHRVLSNHYGAPQDPKDFEESLNILEGGFIKIVGTSVTFVNPSVRDYLQTYLDDFTLLTLAAQTAVQSTWARNVWKYGKRLAMELTQPMPPGRAALARAFLSIARAFLILPTWVRIQKSGPNERFAASGLSNVERIELMIDWLYASSDDAFLPLIGALAGNPVEGWKPWRDGDSLLILIGKLRDPDYFGEMPQAADIADTLEAGAVLMIEGGGFDTDDLDKLSDACEKWKRYLGPEVRQAVNAEIQREFEEIDKTLRNMNSESTVDEHIGVLEKLGERTGIPDAVIKRVSEKAVERKIEIESTEEPSSSVRSGENPFVELFDDLALKTLFAPLRRA